ncbi:MAG: phosphotransferase, partial [Pseudomonadota bacterium]|nr:phosphotransferase [Pseudomonadota bacterium]
MRQSTKRSLLAALCLSSAMLSGTALASPADHREFDAMLHAPYRADPALRGADAARTFSLQFSFPGVEREQAVGWRLDLLSPTGRVVQRWYGLEALHHAPLSISVPWAG